MGSTISRARPRLSGPGLSAPVFSPSGQVFAISGRGPGAEIVEVSEQGPVHLVSIPSAVQAQGVSAVAISRDGARAAMVVGPRGQRSMLVGALSTARGAPKISRITVVLPADRDVRGVAWASATDLVTTVAVRHGQRAVMRTSVDGYRPHLLSRSGLPTRPHQVAAAPGQPILTTAGGAVWSLVGRTWQRVSTGRDPSYAE
jgi:dipeptidyl aminopeptidase/acylaminoacyl peptidase